MVMVKVVSLTVVATVSTEVYQPAMWFLKGALTSCWTPQPEIAMPSLIFGRLPKLAKIP